MAEWQQVGKKYFTLVYKNPKKTLHLIEKIIYSATSIYNFSKTIPVESHLKKLTDIQLYKIYQEFHKWHHKIWSLAMTPNLLEAESSFLIDYITNLVEKNKNKWSMNLPTYKVVDTLIYSSEKSWLEKKNEDYFRLLINLHRNTKKGEQLINTYYKKYSWLEYNWPGPFPGKKILLKQINSDLKKKIDYQKKLKLVITERKEKEELKEKYFKKIKLNNKDKILIKILERLYYSKGYRLDCCYFAYSQMERFFKEIAKRLHLTLHQVYSIIPNEMKSYIVERIVDINRLNKLYNKSVIYWDGKEIRILLEDKAEQFLKSMTEEDLIKGKEVKKLKGQIAFRGKVCGVVKVVNQRSEIKKFKKGNILVSGHTDPSLMPAIIKAAAIVTNFGGMTCHAAIVSRELKIPCIVGLKIATKVLKDGDEVEVDANKGVVTILKK